MFDIVRQTPVSRDGVHLTVVTVKRDNGEYDTAVVDESPDGRHTGKTLPAHEHEGRRYGPYVISQTREPAYTRSEAMDHHREALYAARTETPA